MSCCGVVLCYCSVVTRRHVDTAGVSRPIITYTLIKNCAVIPVVNVNIISAFLIDPTSGLRCRAMVIKTALTGYCSSQIAIKRIRFLLEGQNDNK